MSASSRRYAATSWSFHSKSCVSSASGKHLELWTASEGPCWGLCPAGSCGSWWYALSSGCPSLPSPDFEHRKPWMKSVGDNSGFIKWTRRTSAACRRWLRLSRSIGYSCAQCEEYGVRT